jgi:hypothetical protein
MLAMCRRWLLSTAGLPIPPNSCATPTADDWVTIERLAHAHNVEALLSVAIAQTPPLHHSVPDALQARWERAYYANRISNTEALDMLERLREACARDGVSWIVLKGPAAMAAVYGDVGLRSMADLDVLCHPRDLLTVCRAARRLGFGDGLAHMYHVVLSLSGGGGGLLEAHFAMHPEMANPSRFLENAWATQTSAQVETWTLPVMSVESQIVFDVAHLADHGFEVDLRHAMDFAGRLWRQRDVIDVMQLRRLLDDAGLAVPCWQLATTLQRWLDLPMTDRLGPAPDAHDADAFERQLLDWSLGQGVAVPRFAAAGVRRQSGVIDTLAYTFRRLCPPPVAMQAAYDLPTRAHALARVPVYAGQALVDVLRRARRE